MPASDRDIPVVAIDTETFLIAQGLRAPPLVCVSYCQPGQEPGLLHHSEAFGPLAHWLTRAAEGRLIITGFNLAGFDLPVVAANHPQLIHLIFAALDAGMIRDTKIQEKLLDLAAGRLGIRPNPNSDKNMKVFYNLNEVWQRRGHAPMDKGADSWRLRYGELYEVGLPHWPEAAVAYPKKDAQTHLDLFFEQAHDEAELQAYFPDVLGDSAAQSRKAFGLELNSCRGLKTDPERVGKLEAELIEKRDRSFALLKEYGWVGKNGKSITEAPQKELVEAWGMSQVTEEMRERSEDPLAHDLEIARAEGLIKLTKGKATSISADVLKQIPDERLQTKVAHAKAVKNLGTYVDKLKRGFDYPIQTGVNSLLETGRVSMSGWTGFPREQGFRSPSVITLPRFGGIRECFVPRDGYYFADVDYAVAELRSLGQVMLNLGLDSPFARGFQADPTMDPHTELAAQMMGISVEKAFVLKGQGKLARRHDAKAGNFGVPGGMGIDRFISSEAEKYWKEDGKQGGLYTKEQAKEIKDQVVTRWGLKPYFSYISDLTKWGNATIKQFVSGRYRGGVGYCDGANGEFQALTADYASQSNYRCVKATYDPNNPLYGSYIVLFTHDQNQAEVPIGNAHEAAEEISRIMVETANEYTPDVPAVAEPALCDRFSKGVETVRDEHGRLQLWMP